MIGIYQGRLSKAPRNQLQYYPKDPFKEIVLAKKIGYDYIELFSDEKFNPNNIIWDKKKIKKFNSIRKTNKIKILSFCDNYVLNHNILNKKILNYIKKILPSLSLLNIKILTLPLYEKSLINDSNILKFVNTLRYISNLLNKKRIKLSIEADISVDSFLKLKKMVNKKNLYFTFDTGNRYLKNKSFFNEIISFKKNILHIHLKDRDLRDKNVVLGTGKLNFKLFFINLKKINYSGSITIESSRGKNYLKSGKKNFLFVKKSLIK